MLLQDKIALATGAGSGIGRAVALAFAREGARIAVADLDSAGGEETVTMIRRAGGEAFFAWADVARAVDSRQLVERVAWLARPRASDVTGACDCADGGCLAR